MTRSITATTAHWLLAACLGIAAAHAASAPEQARVHPPFRGTVPAKSDVVFSSRFAQPDSLPIIESFGATRVEWVYAKDEPFARALQRDGRLFGATLNANGPLPDDDGYARDFDGRVLVVPWMKGWNGRWVTTTHPDTQRVFEEQVRRALELGARSLQHDDPQLQAFTGLNQAGDFNEGTLAGFPAWLGRHPDRNAVEAAGMVGFSGNYRQWLRDKHGVVDADDYRRRFRTFPSTRLWIDYLRSTVVEHFIRVRRIAADIRGTAVPISMNLSALYEPLESNPFFFLAAQADFSMAETHINDWPQMVSQAATARALGLGFVPSIRPRSTAENRVAIAALYALGGQPIVPWDVYVGNDENGKAKRFFGAPEDYGDLYRFVRANAALFDGKELAAQVGVIVPVAKGRQDQVRTLVRHLVDNNIGFAFVPVGANLRVDVERLRKHALLVLTNPDADYPSDVLQALSRTDVRLVRAGEMSDTEWSGLRSVVAAPGAEHLRILMRADPADASRLLVHVIDEVRGEPGAADAACTRRLGIRRDRLGSRAIAAATWYSPQARKTVTPQSDAKNYFMTLHGCALWGVLELRLAP
jgi:hypothetical protein